MQRHRTREQEEGRKEIREPAERARVGAGREGRGQSERWRAAQGQGGAGGITHAHTWTCTELRGAGVGGGVYTDEKETRMKDAEGENAGE